MNPALLSSVKQDWRTPQKILDLVRKVKPIDVDPATSADNPTGAIQRFFTSDNDGLIQDWGVFQMEGLVYCNPPYSNLKEWSSKMSAEGLRGTEIIGLVPSRTDTKWWRDITTAAVICFWRGRITFEGAPASAPFPSAIPYWGPTPDRFCEVFGPYGWLV